MCIGSTCIGTLLLGPTYHHPITPVMVRYFPGSEFRLACCWPTVREVLPAQAILIKMSVVLWRDWKTLLLLVSKRPGFLPKQAKALTTPVTKSSQGVLLGTNCFLFLLINWLIRKRHHSNGYLVVDSAIMVRLLLQLIMRVGGVGAAINFRPAKIFGVGARDPVSVGGVGKTNTQMKFLRADCWA